MSVSTTRPLLGPVHHLGYVVPELEAAVDAVVRASGAGPFFRMDHVPLDEITHAGAPAIWDHSSAFGQCGDVAIELMVIHRCEPEQVARAFPGGPHPVLHHLAWAVPDPDAAVTALEADGVAVWLAARLGDIRFTYHDATAGLGHHVEIHHDNPAFQGFFAMIRDASQGWDGSEPLRALTG